MTWNAGREGEKAGNELRGAEEWQRLGAVGWGWL